MKLDLAKIDTPAASEEGCELELKFPGHDQTGWFVTVRGELSTTVKTWQLGIGNKMRLREWQEKRKSKNENPTPMTTEDMEFGLKAAVVRISGMRGIVMNGKELPYSPDAAYELVKRHPPFADQVLEFSVDVGNFSKAQ